jgi:hypothetical protein
MMLKNLMLSATAAMIFSLVGCESDKGPAEKAGAKIDNAVEEAGDKIEDAGDKVEDKLSK